VRLPFSHQRERDNDPYWDAFINTPPADPNNVIPNAFSQVHDGETNPVRTEVHSPNVQSSHIKELGRFYGADLIGIVRLPAVSGTASFSPEGVPSGIDRVSDSIHSPEGVPSGVQCFAIVTVLKADYDTRISKGIGGQTPALKGLFATFTLAAYIRELGYRATRVFGEDQRGERLAAAAGLGQLNADGRLVTPRSGRLVYVAELIVTDLPLEPDGHEIAP
jgi:hypothetical protein